MSSGIDPLQLRELVIRPVLDLLHLGGEAAEEIMLGTAFQESGDGHWIAQVRGPARGIWQMEPATHDDLWKNFLPSRTGLTLAIHSLRLSTGIITPTDQMEGNDYYACAMARVLYLRAPEPLPAAGDLTAQAAFYKAHYNTAAGAATVAEYIANWRRAFPPENA